jgi:hypothetical protein
VLCHDEKRVVRCTQDTQHTVGLSCGRTMERRRDERCDMPLTLDACDSAAGTAARERSLRYPGRRDPNADVFRRLKQRVSETGSVTPTAHVNAVAHGPDGHQPVRCHSRSRGEARGSYGYPSRGLSKYFVTFRGIQTTARGANVCFQTIGLSGCSFGTGYDMNMLRMNSWYTTFCGHMKRVLRVTVSSASSGHGTILMVSRPLQRPCLGWYRPGHCPGPHLLTS